MTDTTAPSGPLRVLDLKPRREQAVKPAELIQITGHQGLTLNARRAITILWHNAHLQGVKEGKDYVIEIDDLKPDHHKGYEMIEEAIIALMGTILTVRMADGHTRRVQFLGGNDLDAPDRIAGTLTYSFDKRLVEILKDSAIWGKITLPVLMAFTSKYAVSLYENASQWTGLGRKVFHELSLQEFRSMLGVEANKYEAFGALNKHVLKPVLMEINALAPFNLSITPVKEGKKVTRLRVSWWNKNRDEMIAAWHELHQPKFGRRARISGQTDRVQVHEALPGTSRIPRRTNGDPS